MDRLLEPYAVIVDFLADYLGEHTEIVLHDLTDLEHSIKKCNGHISGRLLQAGHPAWYKSLCLSPGCAGSLCIPDLPNGGTKVH